MLTKLHMRDMNDRVVLLTFSKIAITPSEIKDGFGNKFDQPSIKPKNYIVPSSRLYHEKVLKDCLVKYTSELVKLYLGL